MAIITGVIGGGDNGGTPPDLDPNEHSGSGLFIYDVEPLDGKNVNITRGASLGGEAAAVVGLSTDSNSIRVRVCWDRTEVALVGLPTVNGVYVTIDDGSMAKATSSPTFTGYADITPTNSITIVYGDAEYVVPSSIAPTPVISNFTLDASSIPSGQTEFKAGDTVTVNFDVDIPIRLVQALHTAGVTALADASQPIAGSSLSHSLTMTVGASGSYGDTARDLVGRIRVQSKENAWSANADSDNTIPCNDQKPVPNVGAIGYPVGQGALKDAERANIPFNPQYWDTINVTSPNNEVNPDLADPAGDFGVTRANGDYNVTVPNLRFELTRAANGTSAVEEVVVFIANVAATVSVSEPAARLQSGTSHTITITSDQILSQQVTLRGSLVLGNIQGDAGNKAAQTYTFSLPDTAEKGDGLWENLIAINLSGKATVAITGDDTYTLGGFVSREVALPPFAAEVTLSVKTITPSKVSVTWLTADGNPINNTPAGGVLIYDAVDAVKVNSFTVFQNPDDTTTIKILDKSKTDASSVASRLIIAENV